MVQGVIDFWGQLFTDPFGALHNATQAIVDFLNGIFPGLGDTVQGVIDFWAGLFQDPFGALHNAVQGIIDFIDGIFPGAKDTIQGVIDFWAGLFQDPFGALRNAAQGIIDWFTSFFHLPEIKFPEIKLPHFGIEGEFNLMTWPPQIPHITVDWYAKGGILNAPTIFGASGGSLLGGGEAGPEAVLPISNLQNYIDVAMERHLGENSTDRIVDAIGHINDRVTVLELDGQKLAQGMAGYTDRVNGSRQDLVSRGLAL